MSSAIQNSVGDLLDTVKSTFNIGEEVKETTTQPQQTQEPTSDQRAHRFRKIFNLGFSKK